MALRFAGSQSGARPHYRKKREALLFMLSYVKRHGARVLGGIALLMAVDLIQIVIPRIIQRIIDQLSAESFSYSVIVQNTLYILVMACGMVVLRFFWRILIVGSSRKIEQEVRSDMFSHIQRLSFSFFNRTHTGDLMALMINDVNAVRMATGMAFIALTDALFMGTLSLVFMFSINARLALLAITPLPLILLLMAKFGPSIQSRFTAVQESFGVISSHAQESFSGVRVVKGFVREKTETGALRQKSDDYVQKNIRLIRIWGFFFPAVTLLANLSLAILFLIGGRSIIAGALTFGEFVSFTIYIDLFVWPVVAIGWVFTLFQRGIASSRRILELLDERSDVPESERADARIASISGAVSMRGLSFRYTKDGREVLKDIHLDVPAGSTLGIMGKPGSGKSTLVSILFRLFPVEDPVVLIDGRDIHEIPLSVLRRSIGYVPQDPFLFSDTIRNNIAFGADGEGQPEGEIVRAAKLAAIHDEIVSFKDGYETLIGERGITLSGGQKQRLSIARALFIRPQILILDDAFSSVDAATEREVLGNVCKEMKGKTMIMVSHRVSTVRECDRIIVLEDGRLSEQGTHRELLKLGRYYGTLYELQKLEEKILA